MTAYISRKYSRSLPILPTLTASARLSVVVLATTFTADCPNALSNLRQWIILYILNTLSRSNSFRAAVSADVRSASFMTKKVRYTRSNRSNSTPNGEWIEVLDNNFFANPDWKSAIDYLIKAGQKVNLHGVDIRIMNEEQAYWLNKLRLRRNIHIAWDLPALDLTDKLREVTRYIKPYKIMCYVLVGFNSTIEQDMYRIETLRSFGIKPYVMPYRDFENKRTPSQYEKDLAQYVNKPQIFKTCSFADFMPRKGFKCEAYLHNLR